MADSEVGIRFRYFAIILFGAATVFGEEVNLHKGHGALVKAYTISLHHVHDLTNESVNGGCPNNVCMV